jgi:hypothetical protein
MTDATLTILVAAIPTTVAAITTMVVSLRTGRRVEEVHVATNSMKDALVARTRSDALQEGKAAGIAEQKAKQGAKEIATAAGHDAGVIEERDKHKP